MGGMSGHRAFHTQHQVWKQGSRSFQSQQSSRCYIMPISETDKDRIISAWLSRHNYSKAAELLGMDRKTVRRWVMRWVGGESMRHRRGGGRKPLLSHQARETVVELLHSKKCGTTREAAAQLHALVLSSVGGRLRARARRPAAAGVLGPAGAADQHNARRALRASSGGRMRAGGFCANGSEQ